jgi:hypothetical protein
MYTLLGIDAVLRITIALVLLFLVVPRLARKRPAELDRLEWFWWCFAAGVTLLTVAGQLFPLRYRHATRTLLVAIAALVLGVRAKVTGRKPAAQLHDLYRNVVLFSLNILEGRVNVPRRLRRLRRHGVRRLAAAFRSGAKRPHSLAWTALIAIAAAIRLYRPFATANLGFSDTYVHLYLIRLLEQGKQVDPAWGPYPRGMHFLLMAIREVTNVDPILLMNFFGPISGVLMTLAVADAARRLARSLTAGLLAGLIFATMVGGAAQYFLLGGSIATDNLTEARSFSQMTYADMPETTAEFDVLMTVFQRQTATLPQELAIVFLFPAVMFLYFDKGWWHRTGFLFCTAAIAAVHPGVAVPLVLLCGITVLTSSRAERGTRPGGGGDPAAAGPTRFLAGVRDDVKRALALGALGIVIGSSWMLGFIGYPRIGSPEGGASSAGSTAAYYFPFLREGDTARIVTWVTITPFLIACLVLALVLLFRRHYWIAAATFVFALTHVASRFGLPEIVEVRRNASWLAMTLAILLGIALFELARVRFAKIAIAVLMAVWLVRVPVAAAHEKLINYSGYGATAYAVLEIQRKHEPFTWTLVTYGQEFPMVLGRGFHLAAAEFLDRFDPEAKKLKIPTRYVFIAVEKTPHRFQINTWATQFSRADVEQRLQTWCFLYQLNHRDMRVFMDDENVRVYVIERDPDRLAEASR